MSNKKLHLILGLVLAMLVGVVGSFTSAISFKITFGGSAIPARAGYMRRNMTPIHFKDNGNDFGGFIYFSNGIGTGGAEVDGDYLVELGDQKYECQQRAKGFYYNAERGERLRILDDSYSMGAEMSGGLYTRCRQQGFKGAMEKCGEKTNETAREKCEKEAREAYVDSHGYYGMIWHKYGDTEFVLAAGTKYESDGDQRVMTDELAPTLIRFDNKYPVGFIYDGNGGVGFLGGMLTDDKEIEDIFDSIGNRNLDQIFQPGDGDGISPIAGFEWIDTHLGGSSKNSLLSVIVDGLVGINRDTKNTGIQGNQSNDKMQYFSSVNINNMQLINYAKQRAEILCRGKWEKFSGYESPLKSLYCFDDANGDTIGAVTGTTIVVKNRNVQVMNMNDFDNGGNYDIFVDNGNLIIDELPGDELKVFKNNGFINESMSVDQFSGDVFPILNSNDSYTGDEVVAGKFIKGNFIVNGNVKSKNGSGFEHVYFVYGKMTTKDTVDELSQVFKWRCQWGIQGTDGTPCPGEEKGVDGSVTWTNPYENASLVIIDQNYPSPLYQ